MGIDRDIAKLLLWSRRQGVDFSRTLTIGRTGLHLSAAELRAILAKNGIVLGASEAASLFTSQEGYAEPFFRLLGAIEPASLDASPFEGATLIHDLNQPAPRTWHAKYSLVFDGGTLEHVFNYPTALRSCLEMVEVGGHFFTVTPANNYMGHGFFQFSPELFARVLAPENGYVLDKMVVFESGTNRWFEVIDPAKAGSRVSLINTRPTMLAAWTRRTHEVAIFAQPPQQSDYVEEWSAYEGQPRACREAERHQKSWFRRWFRIARKWFKPRYPAEFYRRVDVA